MLRVIRKIDQKKRTLAAPDMETALLSCRTTCGLNGEFSLETPDGYAVEDAASLKDKDVEVVVIEG